MSPHAIASVGAVSCTVSAHLALRRAARAGGRNERVICTLVALALFGGTTLLGLYSLAGLPLKTTTVWAAASYPAVSILARVLFGERSSFLGWLGVGFVVAGIVLFGLS